MARRPGNRYRKGAKFIEEAFERLAYCFCQGLGVDLAARNTGLSRKSVRGLYLDLRRRLLAPHFARWNRLDRTFVNLPTPALGKALSARYLKVLSACSGNSVCGRNFRLGNRKSRQCRNCPLVGTIPASARPEAYTLIDALRVFYARLGIRGEDENDLPVFRERLAHFTTVATVQNNSRTLASGFFDPNDRGFLSGGTLLELLLTELERDPI